ncbi:hypothetical protein GCM10008931_41100 [Oceanobacillus oncorhynchi subsp. oncorhynchi]|uniref:hypothetical protein n=1 Tax=Oceanobacillus oncorhynchi TaxID=545501 RepID=UPI0031CE9423
MVKLDKLNIDFDCNKETPYFQVNPNQRIRFGMEDLTPSLIRKVVEEVLSEKDNINVVFISEYIINNKRFSSKSRIGKFININNWKESIEIDECGDEGVVYATIRDVDRNDVLKYCLKVFNGQNEAFISFFTEEVLLYLNSDVIDIVSNNRSKIDSLKQNYAGIFNKYYEE